MVAGCKSTPLVPIDERSDRAQTLSKTQQEDQHARVVLPHVALLFQRLEAVLDERLDIPVEVLLLRVELAVDGVDDTIRKVKDQFAVEDRVLCPS